MTGHNFFLVDLTRNVTYIYILFKGSHIYVEIVGWTWLDFGTTPFIRLPVYSGPYSISTDFWTPSIF